MILTFTRYQHRQRDHLGARQGYEPQSEVWRQPVEDPTWPSPAVQILVLSQTFGDSFRGIKSPHCAQSSFRRWNHVKSSSFLHHCFRTHNASVTLDKVWPFGFIEGWFAEFRSAFPALLCLWRRFSLLRVLNRQTAHLPTERSQKPNHWWFEQVFCELLHQKEVEAGVTTPSNSFRI